MLKSMTAFGRGEKQTKCMKISAEIRGVNHRFRDIVLRLPRPLLPLEEDVRTRIASSVSRGRIECVFQMEMLGEQPAAEVELNVPLAKAYLEAFRDLNERFGLDAGISARELCAFKDVILARPVEADLEALRLEVDQVLGEALDSLEGMRKREGETIERDFADRLTEISGRLERVAERAPVVVEEYRVKLRDRVASLAGDLELDENRLAQETAFFAGKSDITEEIVRLRSHIAQFQNYMGRGEPVGRRLDFLIQEMNREVNTISSKASDSAISSEAVEMKGELEKLREQVQNIE